MDPKIFGFLIILLLAGLPLFSTPDPLEVKEVIDGDTIVLSSGDTVRLIGIDTPEIHRSYKMRQQARRTNHDRETIRELGTAARDYMKQLVEGYSLELTYDPANTSTNHRGGFDRLLAYAWVLDESGDRLYMVNRRMVADGYAYAYTKYPFQYMDEFRRLARQARQQNRGLWQTMHPRHKEGDTASAESFRDRDCSSFSSQEEAQQFYEQFEGDPHNLDGDEDGKACEDLP